jgi:hypothetical protein
MQMLTLNIGCITVGDNELTNTSIFFATQIFFWTLLTQLHLILIRTANMPAHEINLNPLKDCIIS